jgi:hypothetical protein
MRKWGGVRVDEGEFVSVDRRKREPSIEASFDTTRGMLFLVADALDGREEGIATTEDGYEN